MRSMPGARSLRLLVSAGRHLNFTRAADELGLTPAAVSFQIREIEDQLGLKLFTRTSRSMRLTEAGAIMVDAAQDAIEALNKGVIRAQRAARGLHLLKVTVDPQFATRWLMRRIENFRKRHPTLELRFDVSYDLRDFELDDVDVAIRFGTGGYPGLASHRLFDNVIVPVCSPALLKRGKGLNEPRDLQDHMLAHIEWSEQGITWPNWRMWMSAAGVSEFDDSRAVVFTHSSDAVQAALAGEAVALVDFAMVANELSQGTLIRPFGLSLRPPPEFAYFLAYPQALTEDHRVIAFRTWLEEEVSKMERA